MISRLLPLAAVCLIGLQVAEAEQRLQRCSEVQLKVIGLFSVGTASLHLPDCSQADRVLERIPKMFSLELDRDIAGADLIDSAEDLLVENLDAASVDDLPPELVCLARAYVDADEGERFDVIYRPEDSLSLYRDDNLLRECPDRGDGHRYFHIWFGEEPFNERMKRKLLERASAG